MDIRSLRKEGHSIRAIARQSGLSRNTVRRVLREPAPRVFRKPARRSCLDPYKAYLRQRWEESGLSGVRLLEEIRPMGYAGSAATVRRFLHALEPEQERLVRLTVRFETAPGRQAQVDWAHAGRLPEAAGASFPVYLFVMVLGFSRMLYVEFTRSTKLAELLACHRRAFDYFGGWPLEVLYDNMKQVRLGPGEIHPGRADFAHHYGFAVKTHRVRRPRTKGKVERMVDYVKENFLRGRRFADLAELNAQAQHWLAHTANCRVHATTGRAPSDLCKEEKLTPSGSVPPYVIHEWVSRRAGFDGLVRFERGRYSLPADYAGRRVEIARAGGTIVIRAGDMILAQHPPAAKPGAIVASPEHVAQLWRLSLRAPRPAPPHWDLAAQPAIERRSLDVYQEACR